MAAAQTAERSGWTIQPRASATETYTDNVSQNRADTTSEFVTELAAGVRASANSARLKANLDYGLTEAFYARDSSPRRTSHSLGSSGTFEAIDDQGYVDFTANISQQRVSAFGPQSQGSFSLNGNTAETSTYSVSPHLRGRLGSVAEYRIRYSATTQRADTASQNDVFTDQWSGTLSGDSPSSRFLWAVSGNTQRSRYGDQPDSIAATTNGRLTYLADVEYRIWASAGRESNDFGAQVKSSYSTRGAGIEWNPGPRTSVALSRERRFFGDSDSVTISHRMAQAMLVYNQAESVSVIPNQIGVAGASTLYDFLFALYAVRYPDPVQRALEVNRLIAVGNASPNDLVFDLFLANRVSIQKVQSLTAVFFGARNSVSIGGSRTENRSLVDGVFGDSFDSSDVIRQRMFNVSWTHQLSPASSFNFAASRSNSEGSAASALSSTTKTASSGFQTRLGYSTNLSAGLSRSESEGASSAYTANTATVSISHTF